MSEHKTDGLNMANVLANLVVAGYSNHDLEKAVVAIATCSADGDYNAHFMSINDQSDVVPMRTVTDQGFSESVFKVVDEKYNQGDKSLKKDGVEVMDCTGRKTNTVGDLAASFITKNYNEFDTELTSGALVGSYESVAGCMTITAGLVGDDGLATQHGTYHMVGDQPLPPMLTSFKDNMVQQARAAASCICFVDNYIDVVVQLDKALAEKK